ncbi:MAG: VCBS repeat-containing protein [Planctomycetes bacterium]|nr:VCBS repeat-containing protein [Planctomycetota bacterium]
MLIRPLLTISVAALAFACHDRAGEEEAVLAGAGEGPVELKSLAVHAEPELISALDVNGDGHLDIVVGGAEVSVLLGDGKFGFAAASGSPWKGFSEALEFACADFDGDGLGDIVFADHGSAEARFWILLGQTGGGFQLSPHGPFRVNATPHLHSLAARDFNNDGSIDIVTDSWPESRLVFVPGDGNGKFRSTGTPFSVPQVPIMNLRSADMNGDGFDDIVTPAHESSSVAVLLGDGEGDFKQVAGSPFKSFGGYTRVELADWDRDGDMDVVALHQSDRTTPFKIDALSIMLNDGDGNLHHAEGSPIQGLPQRSDHLAVADLNGDGWLDAATLGQQGRMLAIHFGGKAGMQPGGLFPLAEMARGLALADFDSDGRCEVLVTDYTKGRVLVLTLP